MSSCPRGEGEGRGRKKKTEGRESQPPTNGKKGTRETSRAPANEEKGETEAGAKAERWPSLGCFPANFNPWLPGARPVSGGGGGDSRNS